MKYCCVLPLFALAVLCCCCCADSIGFNGCYKNGLWTRINVEGGGSFELNTSDGDGTPLVFFGSGGTVYAKLGRANEKITVRTASSLPQYFTVPEPVRPEKPIYLIIGSDNIGLQGAVAELALKESRRPLLLKIKSLDELPDNELGYDAVNLVVLNTDGLPPQAAALTNDSPQITALENWLHNGGTMLFIAGQTAGQYLEKDNGALRPFLPGKFSEMTELRQGKPFEDFIGSQRTIYMTGTQDAPFMKMPRFTQPRGIIFAKDGDCPLILRTAYGLGTLIYFGGGLSVKPLSGWKDRVQLVSKVMQWDDKGRDTQRDELYRQSGQILQLGFDDIAGQIRSALDRGQKAADTLQRRTVPFSLILIILTAYWLCIGLVDWFFVRKYLNRPALTWLTFPLWIILFSGLAYTLTNYAHPDTAIANQLELTDISVNCPVLVRSSVWTNLYSPKDATYDILAPYASPSTKNVAYFGLPGSGFGGMAPKTVSPRIWKRNAVQKNPAELYGVPIQIHSSKCFFEQTIEPSKSGADSCPVMTDLSDEEGIPVGILTAGAEFPVLENCLLLYGRWAIEVGTIKPNQKIIFDRKTLRRENKEFLSAYHPNTTDLESIVRVLTLHQYFGGYNGTGLNCVFQSVLDMSNILTADTAVLIGKNTNERKTALPVATDKSPVTATGTSFVRIVIPIKLSELSPRLNIKQEYLKSDELEEKVNPANMIE